MKKRCYSFYFINDIVLGGKKYAIQCYMNITVIQQFNFINKLTICILRASKIRK